MSVQIMEKLDGLDGKNPAPWSSGVYLALSTHLLGGLLVRAPPCAQKAKSTYCQQPTLPSDSEKLHITEMRILSRLVHVRFTWNKATRVLKEISLYTSQYI